MDETKGWRKEEMDKSKEVHTTNNGVVSLLYANGNCLL